MSSGDGGSFVNSTLGLNNTGSVADNREGQSAGQFAASLVTAIVVFSVQALIFLFIKDRFARIYQPRTYLVPPREQTDPPAPGWFKWAKGILSTSNREFIQKCGLDAYFFLRYLRTLLKIFVPAACVILPVLIPLNAVDGRGSVWELTHPNSTNVTGLDQLAWGNVQPKNTNRYWAHWILALFLIVWVCYVAFDELRNYIRIRQAFMTHPQHRLRASATTVLVSAIPPKWNSVEKLDQLYDVFPGGIRNIWINRNFDELSEKVSRRDQLASKLEAAETELVKKCFKKNEENIAKAEKEAGKKFTKAERRRKADIKDARGREQAQGHGLTSGNPHQVKHTIREELGEDAPADEKSVSDSDEEREMKNKERDKYLLPIPVVGEGVHAVTHGIEKFGRSIIGGVRGVNRGVNDTLNTTNGFVAAPGDIGHGITFHDAATTAHVPHPHHDSDVPRLSAPTDHHHVEQAQLSPGLQAELDGGYSGTAANRVRDNDQQPLQQPSPTSTTSTADESVARAENAKAEKTKAEKTKSEKRKGEKAKAQKPLASKWQTFKKSIGLGKDDGKDEDKDEEDKEPVEYAEAYNDEFVDDSEDAVWRKYLTEKDRETYRLPIFGWQWMPSLPLIGEKVDTIYYCRKEVARLNVEIEDDQAHQERFPLMNSAFIQFNAQVAAHMACQSVSHHTPKHMAPRLVEIDPNDVIWDNMSIPWWQSYVRTAGVITIVAGMIVLWAIPVAFTSALSQLNTAANSYPFLHWLLEVPQTLLTILQGILPTVFLALLMFLLPVILRALSRLEGTKSGMLVELSVQRYYFFFLFVQIFLVVTVANSAITFLSSVNINSLTNIPNLLAINIPRTSNYFFSYMLLQALSVSAGALVQVGSLIGWFIFAPLFDNTARAKFKRQTSLSEIQWGTFFPVYTNLACIGLIFSVISPLILVFNTITFSLFWFVYRYNTLYVTKFLRDTGGLLYPNAINYTFVGIYIAEVSLVGLFFLVRDEQDRVACQGQAIGMIVILVLTVTYQILLNNAFSPLFRYLPITLEDDAVKRDAEYALELSARHGSGHEHDKLIENEREDEEIEDQLKERERDSLDERRDPREQYEMKQIQKRQSAMSKGTGHGKGEGIDAEPQRDSVVYDNPQFLDLDVDRESKGLKLSRSVLRKTARAVHLPVQHDRVASDRKVSWADRDNARNRRSNLFGQTYSPSERTHSLQPNVDQSSAQVTPANTTQGRGHQHGISEGKRAIDALNNFNPLLGSEKDIEAQREARKNLSDALFSGVSDELEDLSQEQRDTLVQRAFQHSALRARRPVIWIPRDELGVSDDEVKRMSDFSKNLWVSNVRQGLDSKGRCVYSGAPPDFSEVDLIQL